MNKRILKKNSRNGAPAPYQPRRVLYIALFISLLIHLGTLIEFRRWIPHLRQMSSSVTKKEPVRIKIVQREKDKDADDPHRIIETPQNKTKPPKDPKFAGTVDHTTDHETKVKPDQSIKGANAGVKGTSRDPLRNPLLRPMQPRLEIQPKNSLTQKQFIPDPNARNRINNAKENDEKVMKLMPSAQELLGQSNAGFQDFIDEDMDIGDRIDINTSEYRYLGYFTQMRKEIELVWNYPYEAAMRGIQGKVDIEFIIFKDGSTKRIRVLNSSGYRVLDDAIVSAIRDASPFPPLPESFRKEKLVIKGSFHYTLSNVAGAH